MWEVRSHSGSALELISENLARVRQRIAEAASKSGRNPDSVEIVAVTKGFGISVVEAAHALGLRYFGENRVQEALAKYLPRPPGIVLHMVGHLQRNKAKLAAGIFDVVESLDSVALAAELNRRLGQLGREADVLLEVNIAGEASKYGFEPEQVYSAIKEMENLECLHLRGLMTVAPMAADPEDVRWVFRRLASLRDELQERTGTALPVLSMGMSDDFQVAVEEGATWIRLGRALFGPRQPG